MRHLQTVAARNALAALVLLVAAALCCRVLGGEVVLRLVRGDAPGQKVGTVVTEVDLEAERQLIEAPVSAKGTRTAPKKKELKPKASFDRYSNYMRGILIDGKIPFHRSYKGSYLGRSDEIRVKLADGEHRIDPGNHRFTVAGDKITTADPVFRVRARTLDILLYPVTIIAIDGSAVRDAPAEVLRLPVAPRIFCDGESVLPKEEQVAAGATFKRITLYMMPNTLGMGYRLSPSERDFHVTAKGVVILDEKGRPDTGRDVYTQDGFTIVLPRVAVPLIIRGRGLSVRVGGPGGSFSATKTTRLFLFPARAGANIRFGRRGQNGPFLLPGDFGRYPRRKLLFDAEYAAKKDNLEPRLLAVALPKGSAKAGGVLRARVSAVDAIDQDTLSPPQVGAFLYRQSLLQEDGTLLSNPDGTEALGDWRELTVESTGVANTYAIRIPADLDGSVYYLRIVADRRGHCSPRSGLQADFVQGIAGASQKPRLSVFCPTGRKAYLRGADMPFSVVFKSRGPVPAGAMKVLLRAEKDDYLLVQRMLPVQSAGRHALHFKLAGSATRALKSGNYVLQATLDANASNRWPLRIVEPRRRDGVPHFDDGWLSPNFDSGTEYQNVPDDIRQANRQRAQLARQAAIRGQRCDLQIVDWSSGGAVVQGRDSSSEIAQVEALLRNDLALPAHEVYYYPNYFESVSEALLEQGMDHLTSILCNISQLSLIHSIVEQRNAKMRQYQLVAQIARKYENFIGMNPVFMSTSPLGNSEIPDPTRHLRLVTMEKNFEKKHGFRAPTFAEAIGYMDNILAGKPGNADVAKRWEAHETMVNTLMKDYFEHARKAVEPLFPGLLLSNRGPSWDGSTPPGTYPPIANANQSPLVVFTGHGDSGHDGIWEAYLKTMVFRSSGQECWGVDGSLRNSPYPKHNLAQYLMANAKGFGYLGGGKPEAGLPLHMARVASDILDLKRFLSTYGPALRQVQFRGQVGIYYPLPQSMYDHASLGRQNSLNSLDGAVMQLTMLGYTTEIVTDEMVAAGELQRFKAIVVPLLNHALPKYRKALEQFAKSGKPLILGANSKLVPKGARKINDDFQEVAQARDIWSFQGPLDEAHAWMQSEMRRKLPVLRQALERGGLKPLARPHNDRVLIQTGRAGEAAYTIVANFLYPSWMGTPRITGVPQVSGAIGEANENSLVPQRLQLDFPTGVVVYDLFTQKILPLRPDQDGRQVGECDLSDSNFRILLSLPRRIGGLRLRMPEAVSLGQGFDVQVTILDPAANPMAAIVPLEFTILDSAGQTVSRSTGASSPAPAARLAAPLGYPAGAWKLRVRELAGGLEVETPLTVKVPAKLEELPFGPAVSELPVVHVQDPQLIGRFLTARRQDAAPVLILLDESQVKTRKGAADALAAALKELGVKAQIKKTNAPGVFAKGERLHLFKEMAPSQYIDHHLALIGGEGENVLLEELQESQLFTRPLTANYPGAGRAALALVRSPFAFQRDVLCILAKGDPATAAAIRKLKDLSAAKVAEAPRPVAVAPGKIISRDLTGTARPVPVNSAGNGRAILTITSTPKGERLGFGLSGYGRNVFVLDRQGKVLLEDQVGHIHAAGVTFVGDGDRIAVNADRATYLREADGTLRWRLRHGKVQVDPAGRYVVHQKGGFFTVYDLNLKRLWGFDEWDQYETTREILFGRKAKFMAAIDRGAKLIYRVTGKAPGAAGVYMDAMIVADALTGKEIRRIDVDEAALVQLINRPRATVESIIPLDDGRLYLAIIEEHSFYAPYPDLLLDENLKPIRVQTFKPPLYFGKATPREHRHVLWDRRLAFVVGNQLCLSDPQWRSVHSVKRTHQIMSLAVDRQRRRLVIGDLSGRITVYDAQLKQLWSATMASGPRVAFLPDGAVAAGTVRGVAAMFSSGGEKQWQRSLHRYVPPELVEQRWTEIEKLPGIGGVTGDAWWRQLTENVELDVDQAKLNGEVKPGAPLATSFAGVPFGTYLVQWQHQATSGTPNLNLMIKEHEQPFKDEAPVVLQRLSFVAQATMAKREKSTRYGLLRLGDRPQAVQVKVLAAGAGGVAASRAGTPPAQRPAPRAASRVSIRRLAFPSRNHICIPALYRAGGDVSGTSTGNAGPAQGPATLAAYVDPPAKVGIFMNVEDEGAPHDALGANPSLLINGRMLQSEPGLKKGRWWAGGDGSDRRNKVIIPTYVEINLSKKRVLTHIVIAEDPALARAEVITVDAYVETREVRKNLSAFERRQVKSGFWHNLVKARGNTQAYNVFRFKKPVYTRRVRVYILDGHSSISEIELYGSIPDPRPANTKKGKE